MSLFDDLMGTTAENAANTAADDTYTKQMGAVSDQKMYGDQLAADFAQLGQSYNPYMQTGLTANSALQQLLKDPSFLSSLPGYQFDLQQGTNALDNSAAARGMLNSGRQSKDLMRFGTGLADKTYGDQLARLLGVGNYGMKAVAGQNATAGAGLQGQASQYGQAFGNQYGAAGTIGQGQIAGANAQAAGTQNLMNMGTSLFGSMLGMPMGSPMPTSSYSTGNIGGTGMPGYGGLW